MWRLFSSPCRISRPKYVVWGSLEPYPNRRFDSSDSGGGGGVGVVMNGAADNETHVHTHTHKYRHKEACKLHDTATKRQAAVWIPKC